MRKNYLLLDGGCKLMKRHGVELSRMPIIKADFTYYHLIQVGYYDEWESKFRICTFGAEENISFLISQMVPLEEVHWWRADCNKKWKILGLKDNFDFREMVYDGYLRFESTFYISFRNTNDMNYYSGYYLGDEKIEI